MKVSVIITAYNYARYLGRAIRSIYNQSLHKDEYEIIVVDDASTDETTDVLMDFSEIVKVIRLPENVGLAAARNVGAHKALGQFVVFVDADDYVQHKMLEMQEMFLRFNNDMDAVAVDYFVVNEREEHIERISAHEQPIACGVMFRKDLLFDVGLYDKDFMAREDEDLRIRFLKKHNIYYIKLPLYRYRRHDSNLTNDAAKMDKYSRLLVDKHGEE